MELWLSRWCVLVAYLSSVSLGAQAGIAGADHAARAKTLVERALADNQAYQTLTELVAAAPKRLSGTKGYDDAVEWAVAKMQAIGLSNVRREKVMVPHWERGDVERLVMVVDGVETPLAVTALGGSVPTPESGLEAEVVMVRTFDQVRALGDAAKGKFVFFNRPMPRAFANTFLAYRDAVPQRSSGAVEAAKVGGVGAIVRSMTTKLDDYPHTGAMGYRDGVEKVPAAAVSTLAAEKLAAALKAGKDVRLRLQLSCQWFDDKEAANVVGELVGTERPDEYVVIGGHLDAWDLGVGAHDDGSGCAHSLEAVRLLKACGLPPKRTIRVVLFANEESGLRGGRAYARDHRGEMTRHVAAIESDAGGLLPRGFGGSVPPAVREKLRPITEALRPWGMGALLPGGGGADISPMRPHGVPLFGMVTISHRYFDYHHSATDNLDAVHERELALGAAALAHFASSIADGDALQRRGGTKEEEDESGKVDKWPFADARNTAVFTVADVLAGREWIQAVHHDAEDGAWQFLPASGANMEQAKLVALHRIVELDPSTAELADLPLGWFAWRQSKDGPWRWRKRGR